MSSGVRQRQTPSLSTPTPLGDGRAKALGAALGGGRKLAGGGIGRPL